jgi:hypothetical protein
MFLHLETDLSICSAYRIRKEYHVYVDFACVAKLDDIDDPLASLH